MCFRYAVVVAPVVVLKVSNSSLADSSISILAITRRFEDA